MLLYLFLFSSLVLGLIAEDTISPQQDEVSGTEGESVTLRCSYQTDDTRIYLYWYKHQSDLQAPQFILWKRAKGWTGEHIPDGRYGSQTTDTSTTLTISNLNLADTALYYCALFTTGYALIFGRNISLTVHPRDSSPVAPELFIMSPLLHPDWHLNMTKDKLPPEVCLATGFRPRDGVMVLNINGEPVNISTSDAVMSVKQKSYVFAGFLNRTIHSCELHSISVRADKSGNSNSSVTSITTVNNLADDPCTNFHPEKAKLNFYLLLMNGVRLVFTKTLAFNTLLTIRALVFHL